MLVVPDQHALGIGREGGLAGARQAEEDGSVDRVVRCVVGRAVHRHDALERQQVVQQREDRLLVLAGVFGAADEDGLLVEVQRDDGVGAAVVLGGVRLEARAVDDGEISEELVKLLSLGAAQHVADEEAVPGQLGHHAHLDRMRRVRAADEVLNVVVLALHVLEHVGMQRVEALGRHGAVVFPPDLVFDRGGLDHVLVLRRAAGELARGHVEGAALAQRALAAFQRGLDQRGLHKIVIDIAQPFDPLIFKPELRVHPSKCHLPSSCSRLSGRR